MNFKDFEKLDRILIGIALAILVSSISLIINDEWLFRLNSRSTEDLSQIGSVTSTKKDVRRRLKSDFSWAPVKGKDSVFQGDSIFTGDDSESVISLGTGEEITVSPNSLVVINSEKDTLTLDIDFGSIKGRLGKDKRLIIENKGTRTEVKGQGAVITVGVDAHKNVTVDVVEGEVKLQTENGGVSTLTRNQSEQLSKGERSLTTSSVAPLLPFAEQRIKRTPRGVEFRWRTSLPIKKFNLQIASDKDFQEIVKAASTSNRKLRLRGLATDTRLYWRVTATIQDQPHSTQPVPFFLVTDTPPSLVSPQDGRIIKVKDSDQGKVELHWSEGSPSQEWEVLVSDSSDFSTPKAFYSTSRTFEFPPIRPGVYYWKVRAKDWMDASWSSSRSFQLVIPQKLERPLLYKDNQSVTIGTRLPQKTYQRHIERIKIKPDDYIHPAPVLSWQKVAGAKKYLLEVSTSRSFKNKSLRRQIAGTKYVWQSVRPGRYYWRVRALSDHSKSNYSLPGNLDVRLAAPESRTPPVITEEVPDLALIEAPPPPIEFQWAPTVFAKSYLFEFADNSSFANSLRVNVTGLSRKVQLPKVGKYFWRIQSLDSSDNPISNMSDTFAFEFGRVYSNPTAVGSLQATKPLQNATIIMVGAENKEVLFQWTNPFSKTKFRVDIAKDQDFTSLILSELVPSNYYLHKGDLPAGQLFWRVRAESANYVSPWTTTYRLQVEMENQNFDFARSENIAQMRVQAAIEKNSIGAAQKTSDNDSEKDLEQLATPVLATATAQFLRTFTANSSQLREPIILKWNQVEGAENYTIELSDEKHFSSKLLAVTTETTQYTWANPEPGLYYWRVRAASHYHKPSPYSSVGEISVLVDAPNSQLQSNIIEVPMHTQGWIQSVPVRLAWTPVKKAASYEIQISEDKSFSRAQNKRSTKPHFTYPASKPQTYYWRVRALNWRLRPMTPFSSTYELTIKEGPVLKKQADLRTPRPQRKVARVASEVIPDQAQILAAPQLIKFSRKGFQQPAQIKFRWQSVPRASGYIIEIAKDRTFSQKLISSSTAGENYIWEEPDVGTFYWRVRATSENHSIGHLSQYSEVRILGRSPQAAGSDQIIDRRASWMAPAPFRVTWNSMKNVSYYELEFSKSVRFSKPLTFRTRSNFKALKVSKFGTYFWRVRALDSHLKPISPFSHVRPVQVVSLSRAPASGQITEFPDTEREIIIPNKVAANIFFKWSAPESESYTLEVFKQGQSKPLLSRQTSNSQITIPIKTDAGEYVWRVGYLKSGQLHYSKKIPFKLKAPN